MRERERQAAGRVTCLILPCRCLLKEAVVKIRVEQLLQMFSTLVMSSCPRRRCTPRLLGYRVREADGGESTVVILPYRCLLKEAVVKLRVLQLIKMLSVLLVLSSCRRCTLGLAGPGISLVHVLKHFLARLHISNKAFGSAVGLAMGIIMTLVAV